MFRNLLFDWSGTLCDDLALTLEATNYVLSQYGHQALDREAFRAEFQLPYPDYYKWKVPCATLNELEKHYRHAFDQSLTNVSIIPHAQEFMDFCAQRGIRCFAFTSMDPKAFDAQAIQLGIKPYFESIHSGIRNKEEHIHHLMQKHALRPEETAMIGDMQHDMHAAHRAGITAIGVLTGYNNAEQLSVASPHITVPNLESLRQLLARKEARPQDSITLKALRISCHIGVPAEERATPQTLDVDIEITPPCSFASMQDNIERTIDYYQLSLRLEELAQSQSWHLIESLAHALACCCVEEFGALRATIEIHKFILPNTQYAAVRTTYAP